MRRQRLTRGLLVFSLCMGGCANAPDFKANLQKIAEIAQPTEAPVIRQPVRTSQTPRRPLSTRSSASMQALFARGTVNGDELVNELKTMREAVATQRTANATAALVGTVERSAAQAGNSGGSVDLGSMLGAASIQVFEALLDQYATSLAHSALDSYLGNLTRDSEGLKAERISLPSAQGLTPPDMQRIVTMAALVVAMRVTNKVMDKAKSDFAGVEQDYSELLKQREQAAGLLFAALERSAKGDLATRKELARVYDDRDQAFIEGRLARLSLTDFSKDMGAQNLAIDYLRQTNPKAANLYQSQTDKTLKRTRAYIQTVGGAAAFGGLLAIYGREMVKVAKSKDAAQMVVAFPFAVDFMKEVPPLVKLTYDVGINGVAVDLGKSFKRFRVSDTERTEDLSDAEAVYRTLKSRKADTLFASALFQDSSTGLLNKIWQCSPSEAGAMLDQAIPSPQRSEFASKVFDMHEGDFLFADALEASSSTKFRDLPLKLLGRDHRRSTDDPTRMFAAIQMRVAERFSVWNTDVLMRLIFANREGAAAYATLQLGDILIRPMPSMQSVYAYESLVDSCRQLTNAPTSRKGSNKAKPGATPSPASTKKPSSGEKT